MKNYCGVINIYKEKGFTSHDVVNIVRKSLGRVKTGHTGTLDPDAVGVLPICLGKATKLADYIAAETKAYSTTIVLGSNTTTQDSTGEIVETFSVPTYSQQDIENVLNSFKGECKQIPPMYSAIKINGRKLYDLARKGEEVERKARDIFIYDITLKQFLPPDRIEIDVICSKGTYIRTLCYDIGKNLGCGAHMHELSRTRSGRFEIEHSIKIDHFKSLVENNLIDDFIQPIHTVLSDYPIVNIPESLNKLLYNGNQIPVNSLDIKYTEKFLVRDCNNYIIGIYLLEGDFIKPVTMLI